MHKMSTYRGISISDSWPHMHDSWRFLGWMRRRRMWDPPGGFDGFGWLGNCMAWWLNLCTSRLHRSLYLLYFLPLAGLRRWKLLIGFCSARCCMFLLPAIDAHFCVLYVPLSDQFPFCHNPSGQLACATKKKTKNRKKESTAATTFSMWKSF